MSTHGPLDGDTDSFLNVAQKGSLTFAFGILTLKAHARQYSAEPLNELTLSEISEVIHSLVCHKASLLGSIEHFVNYP